VASRVKFKDLDFGLKDQGQRLTSYLLTYFVAGMGWEERDIDKMEEKGEGKRWGLPS